MLIRLNGFKFKMKIPLEAKSVRENNAHFALIAHKSAQKTARCYFNKFVLKGRPDQNESSSINTLNKSVRRLDSWAINAKLCSDPRYRSRDIENTAKENLQKLLRGTPKVRVPEIPITSINNITRNNHAHSELKLEIAPTDQNSPNSNRRLKRKSSGHHRSNLGISADVCNTNIHKMLIANVLKRKLIAASSQIGDSHPRKAAIIPDSKETVERIISNFGVLRGNITSRNLNIKHIEYEAQIERKIWMTEARFKQKLLSDLASKPAKKTSTEQVNDRLDELNVLEQKFKRISHQIRAMKSKSTAFSEELHKAQDLVLDFDNRTVS